MAGHKSVPCIGCVCRRLQRFASRWEDLDLEVTFLSIWASASDLVPVAMFFNYINLVSRRLWMTRGGNSHCGRIAPGDSALGRSQTNTSIVEHIRVPSNNSKGPYLCHCRFNECTLAEGKMNHGQALLCHRAYLIRYPAPV